MAEQRKKTSGTPLLLSRLLGRVATLNTEQTIIAMVLALGFSLLRALVPELLKTANHFQFESAAIHRHKPCNGRTHARVLRYECAISAFDHVDVRIAQLRVAILIVFAVLASQQLVHSWCAFGGKLAVEYDHDVMSFGLIGTQAKRYKFVERVWKWTMLCALDVSSFIFKLEPAVQDEELEWFVLVLGGMNEVDCGFWGYEAYSCAGRLDTFDMRHGGCGG